MATTTVEFLSDSSNRTLKIAGILPCHGGVQEEEEGEEQQFAGTPSYIVYAHRANSGLSWSSTWAGRALQQLREVSISNNVRSLLQRVRESSSREFWLLIVASSSLERIGDYCFDGSGVEEARIPDGVRELRDGCFKECKGLRRVNFGSLLSLERIGFQAFLRSLSYLLDHISEK